jgi:hypothetical protein
MCATDGTSDTEGTRMKINSKDFRVRLREKVKLSEWPTVVKPFCKSKEQYQKLLGEHVEELSSLQQLHYASNRYALLLIFKGWTPGARTAPSGTSCPGSIRKAARCSASNSRAPTSWNMIFSGAQWCGCIRRFSAPKDFQKSCATSKLSGRELPLHRGSGKPSLSQRNADR